MREMTTDCFVSADTQAGQTAVNGRVRVRVTRTTAATLRHRDLNDMRMRAVQSMMACDRAGDLDGVRRFDSWDRTLQGMQGETLASA